jgi:hypothetical protein
MYQDYTDTDDPLPSEEVWRCDRKKCHFSVIQLRERNESGEKPI